ncbi:MAG: Lrp/AsnC family transcriptional regulator [Candidatus Bilamarchaeaceae archaeon]
MGREDMPKGYDDLDIAIMRELRDNAKISYKKLAEKLKTHPNTLMQRIKKLEKDGVIRKYSVDIDYRKIGLGLRAIILLRIKGINIVKAKEEGETDFSAILKMPQVVSLYGITGPYDAIVLVEVKDIKDLTETIGKIQSTPGVTRTSTFIILTTYKHSTDYNPFKYEGNR